MTADAFTILHHAVRDWLMAVDGSDAYSSFFKFFYFFYFCFNVIIDAAGRI
jgi:hypothetical protein